MSVYLPLYVILSRNALMHFANSVDIDETPHFAAFDLGLHCLPMAYNTQGNPKRLHDITLLFSNFSNWVFFQSFC